MFHISQSQYWNTGEGTPSKYSVQYELDAIMVSQTDAEALFALTGNVTVTNHPNNSRNGYAASDYAVLTLGTLNTSSYPFTANTSYYKRALPFLPNVSSTSDVLDGVIIEFRGDTYITDGPNLVSLYIKGQGVVLNASSAEQSTTFNVNTTFTLPLTGSNTQPVLVYAGSGCNSSTDYLWVYSRAWASIFDFSYRPGAVWDGSIYQSCNRTNGVCNIYNGSSFIEMRTRDGGVGTDNPPRIYNGTKFVNMSKIGAP